MKNHIEFEFDVDSLKQEVWEEGKHFPVALGPYGRHAFLLIFSERGRQKAQFANGEHNYFAITTVTADQGRKLILDGGAIIPVFPNGDVLMIIEQRGSLLLPGDFSLNRTLEFLDGRDPISLGSCGSVEFPAGSIEPGEGLKAGSLREFVEETGISGHKVKIIRRMHPLWAQIAEFSARTHELVLSLPEVEFSSFVDNDGGLSVVRLSREEFLHNKRNGVLNATHPVFEGWRFLNDVLDSHELNSMLEAGEVEVEYTTI